MILDLLTVSLVSALASQGVEVRDLEQVAEDLHVELQLLDPAVTGRASLEWGATTAGTRVLGVSGTRLVDEGVITWLAVDQSGSFRRYHDDAWDLVEAWVESRGDTERVGLMQFGRSAALTPPTDDEVALRAAVAAARGSGARQQETRLGEYIRRAVQAAHTAQPPSAGGIRQVVVFTDGGEESSTWSVADVVSEAREHRTRVHVVAFYRGSRDPVAQRLDNLSRLAHDTGGTYVQFDDPSRARAELRGAMAAAAAAWRVEVDLCGSGGATDSLTLTASAGGAPLAWTDPLAFTTRESRCPARIGLPSLPGHGADDPDVEELADGPMDSLSPWVCGCTSLGLLAALLGVVALALSAAWSQRDDEDEDASPGPQSAPDSRLTPPVAPPAPPTSTASPPPVTPAPARPARQTQLAQNPEFPAELPETHLIVASSGGGHSSRYRFSGRILRVGAAERNDVTIQLPQVSSHHARFELFPSGDVYVTDLDSTNGTWVGGRRLTSGERALVRPGDRVAVSQQLVLELHQPGREDV